MTRAIQPTSLRTALEALADAGAGATPIAGCTDIMAGDHLTGRRRETVIDLTRIPELAGVRRQAGYLDIGAACTFAEIRRDPDVTRHTPILAEAAATIGAWQIQNRATIGGNIANASPAGDSLPVLLALDAQLLVAGASGIRVIPYADFHTGYRETALRPGEVIVRVHLPLPAPATLQRFRKVGTRAAQAISKVVVAFAARRADHRLEQVRFAAGSVAPTPIRLRAAESACEGHRAGKSAAERAGQAAEDEIGPIDDVRSTAAYRRFVLGRIVRRFVLDAADTPTTRSPEEEGTR